MNYWNEKLDKVNSNILDIEMEISKIKTIIEYNLIKIDKYQENISCLYEENGGIYDYLEDLSIGLDVEQGRKRDIQKNKV